MNYKELESAIKSFTCEKTYMRRGFNTMTDVSLSQKSFNDGYICGIQELEVYVRKILREAEHEAERNY